MKTKRQGKRKWPPRSPDQIAVAPYGEDNCSICQLKAEDLQYLHDLKLKKGWTHKQILEMLRARHEISPSYTIVLKHFKKHLVTGMVELERVDNPEVTAVLSVLPDQVQKLTNDKIEAAYTQLVNMCANFAQTVNDILKEFSLDKEKLKEKFSTSDPITSLSRISTLLREVREQIKDISALRAPKVLVTHLLESAIDDVIRETGFVFSALCRDIQLELRKEISIKKDIDNETFVKVFKTFALQYMDRMLRLKQESMHKAVSALNDMQKII